MTIAEIAMKTLFILVCAQALAWLVMGAAESLRADTARVEAAKTALTEHCAAVRKLLDGDALDDEWREFIIDFSSGVLSRSIAGFVVELVQQHEAGTLMPDPDADGFNERLAELARHAPDTHETLTVATRSGLVAALLQWPETTAAAVRIAVESEAQSAGTAARVRQKAAGRGLDLSGLRAA